jgi:hypothetical protein
MSMEDGGAVASEDEGRTTGIVRLSEIELPTRLGEKYDFLGIVDTLLQQASFHIKISRMKWGANEASVLLLASASIILGSWDFGIGELAGGGDWGRSGILGEDSGFLHLNEWTRMLSLLSVMAWASSIALLWIRFPIMRENFFFLITGMFAVQLGFIFSHASSPDFPFDSEISDWGGVVFSNLILLFICWFVVHRAVVETRDVHVEERHAHPDPRVVERAWEDHRLHAWSSSLAIWAVLINVMSWSGSHAIADRPPIVDGVLGYSVLFVFSGIASYFFLMHVLWYPHFMLGGGEHQIWSSRAREVAGESSSSVAQSIQGSCPVCGGETPVTKRPSGKIEVRCSDSGCKGQGKSGDACVKCATILPSRVVCPSCSSNTTVVSHFSKSEAW